MFNVNQEYTKIDIYKILDVPKRRQKGAWDTGYRRYNNEIFIFCNIGVAGRTGHDYGNVWDGERLLWYGKNKSHLKQPLIREMLTSHRVHIFTRNDNYKPFTYRGLGNISSYEDTVPIKIVWEF
jgi:5-methylcytosine-specific restriction protein A